VAPRRIVQLYKSRLTRLAREIDPERIIQARQGGEPDCRQDGLRCSYLHTASHYELVQTVRGRAHFALPDRSVEVGPGDLMLIDKGVKHAEMHTIPPRSYEVFWCHVKGNRVLLSQTAFSTRRPFRYLSPLEFSGRSDLEGIAAAISAELAAREWGWRESVKGLLHYLVSIAVRRLERETSAATQAREAPAVRGDSHGWQVVRAVLEYCETNYFRRFTLAELADKVGYSPSHLSRLISRHLGHSLSDHLLQIRMAAAKQLLEQPEASVQRVAESLGYADPAHFTRAFTRVAGVSPQAYQRSLRGR